MPVTPLVAKRRSRHIFITPAVFYSALLSIFIFNYTATTEFYTLSLHDALPICSRASTDRRTYAPEPEGGSPAVHHEGGDRKSTRLNSSHVAISYAVFCLKKKNTAHSHRSTSGDRSHYRLPTVLPPPCSRHEPRS